MIPPIDTTPYWTTAVAAPTFPALATDLDVDAVVIGGGITGVTTAGTVLGAGLGMLFAPKAGSELRNQFSEQAGALVNRAQEGYRKVTENAGQLGEKGKEAAGEWAERGKDVYGQARGAVSRGAEEAQKYVRVSRDPFHSG